MGAKYRSFLLTLTDLAIVVASYYLALWIRFDFSLAETTYFRELSQFVPYIVLVYFILFRIFKVDKTLWSSPSVDEALRVSLAAGTSATIVYLIMEVTQHHVIPTSVCIIAGILIILILEFLRFGYRVYRTLITIQKNTNPNHKRTIIVGAGEAGHLLLKEILNNKVYKNNVIGFIDDDPLKVKKMISGFPVLGKTDDVLRIVSDHNIEIIYVAMPSVSVKRQNGLPSFAMRLARK